MKEKKNESGIWNPAHDTLHKYDKLIWKLNQLEFLPITHKEPGDYYVDAKMEVVVFVFRYFYQL